jgi:general secretion pathway protein F
VTASRSGQLGEVLGEYVRYSNLGQTLRSKFKAAIFYPLFLILMVVGLHVFLSFYVVQVFYFILKDFGVQVPAVTQALFAISELTREHGLTCLLIIGVFLLSIWFVFDVFASPVGRRQFYTSLPVFGPLLRWSTLAEFCHMTALLVECRVRLPESLLLASQGVNDAELASIAGKLTIAVESGHSLSAALVLWKRCPAGLVEVLDGSEGRNDLGPALHMAGDMFESRSRAQSTYASSLFGGLTFLFVVSGIGFVVTALYLPMITLLSRLSG